MKNFMNFLLLKKYFAKKKKKKLHRSFLDDFPISSYFMGVLAGIVYKLRCTLFFLFDCLFHCLHSLWDVQIIQYFSSNDDKIKC